MASEQKTRNSGNDTARLRALGHIAGHVAHEINNGLTVVLGNLSLISYTLDDNPDEELSSSLRDTIKASQAIRAQVSKLQSLTSAFAPDRMPVNLTEWLPDCVASWAVDDRECSCECTESELMVSADDAHLTVAIHNLLDNAWEANRGGTVKVEARHVLPVAGSSLEGDPSKSVAINVFDGGEMIPEDVREEMFSPCFSTRKGAAGMGLAVCQTIARRHHGMLIYDPDQLCFRLTLPALKDVDGAGMDRICWQVTPE